MYFCCPESTLLIKASDTCDGIIVETCSCVWRQRRCGGVSESHPTPQPNVVEYKPHTRADHIESRSPTGQHWEKTSEPCLYEDQSKGRFRLALRYTPLSVKHLQIKWRRVLFGTRHEALAVIRPHRGQGRKGRKGQHMSNQA